MSASNQDPQVDAIVEAIKRRIDTDGAFREQISADPEGTLRAAGLPEERAAGVQVTRGEEPSDEVIGYTKWTVSWKCWRETDGSKTCVLF